MPFFNTILQLKVSIVIIGKLSLAQLFNEVSTEGLIMYSSTYMWYGQYISTKEHLRMFITLEHIYGTSNVFHSMIEYISQ